MSPGQPPLEGSAIHEGWLRKSPPFESPNLLFRPRWRKRWMVLVQAQLDTELYILHYFTDDTKSKLKGSINLRHCMSISSNSVLETDKKSKQVNYIKTKLLECRILNIYVPPGSHFQPLYPRPGIPVLLRQQAACSDMDRNPDKCLQTKPILRES